MKFYFWKFLLKISQSCAFFCLNVRFALFCLRVKNTRKVSVFQDVYSLHFFKGNEGSLYRRAESSLFRRSEIS